VDPAARANPRQKTMNNLSIEVISPLDFIMFKLCLEDN